MSLRNLDRYARNLRERVQEWEVAERLEDRFGPYRAEPAAFVEEVLGVNPEPTNARCWRRARRSLGWRGGRRTASGRRRH